ncbi:hypothetical protein HRbin17_01243 [bacterium HR17]|uniref:Uncharacterized protein n=1 Tax=Candidatus Fervidibacter japonicus TaxID=2035412 RepID=A0A2H5XC16_9BACT|nr:hypothetical protein HRbin17_01243 [bacterium HR17]
MGEGAVGVGSTLKWERYPVKKGQAVVWLPLSVSVLSHNNPLRRMNHHSARRVAMSSR